MIKIIFENRKLLTELKIEQVLLRFKSEKFERACIRKGEQPGNVEETLPDYSADPEMDISENDKANFLNWLISYYIRSEITIDSLCELSWKATEETDQTLDYYIELFYQIKAQNLGHLLIKQDINQIETYIEFIKIVRNAIPKYQEHLNKKDYADASKGSNQIFENKEWEIYIPENKGAACDLGKGTDWCTAAPGLKYYELYHTPEDPLIIFISKKDPTEKYQFHYKTKQFKDKNDGNINDGLGSMQFFHMNNIIKSLKDKLPEETIKEANKYIYERFEGGYKIVNNGWTITFNMNHQKHSFDGRPAQIYRDNKDLTGWFRNGKEYYPDEEGNQNWKSLKESKIRIIFENRKLLTELKIEQVMLRFESEKFERACIMVDRKSYMVNKWICHFIPSDISDNDKANFLNWLISIFIRKANTDRIEKEREPPINSEIRRAFGTGLLSDDSFIQIKEIAEIFYQIKAQNIGHLLSKQDINQISSVPELNEIVIAANQKYQEHLKKKDYADASKGTNKIFENEEWEIYIPENKGASCALGKGTDWCTAAPGLEYYERYHTAEDPLIIFISKHNPSEKYQFHYGTKQFKDSKDRSIFVINDHVQFLSFLDIKFFRMNNIIKLLGDELPPNVIGEANKYKFINFEGGYKIATHSFSATFNKDKELHSFNDEPSFMNKEENLWQKNGKLHRENGKPAVIKSYGHKSFYENGQLVNDKEDDSVWQPVKESKIRIIFGEYLNG